MPRPTYHSDRLIYNALESGPKTRRELLKLTGLDTDTLHRRLKVLRSRGLVTHMKRGKEAIYSIDPKAHWLFWDIQLHKPLSKKECRKAARKLASIPQFIATMTSIKRLEEAMGQAKKAVNRIKRVDAQELFDILGLSEQEKSKMNVGAFSWLLYCYAYQMLCLSCLRKRQIVYLRTRYVSGEKVCPNCGRVSTDIEAEYRLIEESFKKGRERFKGDMRWRYYPYPKT